MVGKVHVLTNLHTSLDFVATAVEFSNLILIVSNVYAHFEEPVVCLDNLSIDSEFNTCILQLTSIEHHCVIEVHTSWNCRSAEKVGCLTLVNIKSHSEALVPHTEVKTEVIGCCCLPSKVFIVNERAPERTIVVRTYRISEVGVCAVYVSRSIVLSTSILLTSLTPTETEFEVTDCLYVLEESLFVNLPS